MASCRHIVTLARTVFPAEGSKILHAQDSIILQNVLQMHAGGTTQAASNKMRVDLAITALLNKEEGAFQSSRIVTGALEYNGTFRTGVQNP